MRRMITIALFTFTIVGVCVLIPNKVFACSCGESSIEKRLELSSTVFTGTLVSKDEEGGNILNVDKVWKGDPADGYVYSGFLGMCGTEFEIGNKYLVFTEKFKGKETTSLCSGNKLITDAGKDIKALNHVIQPEWSKHLLLICFASACVLAISLVIWRAKFRLKK
ncbi:hypothetical protein [Cohnella abietis]|uniref:Uncharacterized protein n=1 Tax=Cohnella abietis TaxID=2507935 RepID=A0A3T1D7H3_9BACL|nr:hypothetical protein [Cohnella abietis]BBI34023.1 hypothetical protein KCTCHS21_34220 [Cohnella abietis]